MRLLRTVSAISLLLMAGWSAYAAVAGEPQPLESSEMNNVRLHQIIQRLDAEARGEDGYWVLRVEDLEVTVITDEQADRMRILVPIAAVADLQEGVLSRMLQANFDTALDARYAIAKDIVWAVYIHPLRPLQDGEFLSGIGQTVNLALTFGESYSSGALVFRGGDSAGIQRRQLIERLLEEGSAI